LAALLRLRNNTHFKGLTASEMKGYSSVGRAAVSKTAGREFKPYCPCQFKLRFPREIRGITGTKMAKQENAVTFFQDVRDEARKVTWPSRRELGISTMMVVIMVIAASLFFLGADAVLKMVVDKILFGI
jgi:preprotein translocase subunit SecE